jgi:hypothetical protein
MYDFNLLASINKNFENCYASYSFGLAKDIEDSFRKAIFLYFVVFISFLVLVSTNLQNGTSEK